MKPAGWKKLAYVKSTPKKPRSTLLAVRSFAAIGKINISTVVSLVGLALLYAILIGLIYLALFGEDDG